MTEDEHQTRDGIPADPELTTIIEDTPEDRASALARAVSFGWVPGDDATAALVEGMADAGITIVEGRMFAHRASGRAYALVVKDGRADFVEPSRALAREIYDEVEAVVQSRLKASLRGLASRPDEDADDGWGGAMDSTAILRMSIGRDVIGLMMGGPPKRPPDPEVEDLSRSAMMESFRLLSRSRAGMGILRDLLFRRNA